MQQGQGQGGGGVKRENTPPRTTAASGEEAPPKQVATAMERLSQAGRLIADIRIGADRLLEALFVAAAQPGKPPLNLIHNEEASMRTHLQDLRTLVLNNKEGLTQYHSANMGRPKVKLAWTEKYYARKATFRKRITGLIKKLSELSGLWGLVVCAIIYDSSHPQPNVWPSAEEVYHMVTRFMNMGRRVDNKALVLAESFMKERIAEVKKKLMKQHKKNREMEIKKTLYQCLASKEVKNVSMLDVRDLMKLIDQTSNFVGQRIEHLRMATAQSQMTQDKGTHQSGMEETTAGDIIEL